MKKEIMKKWVKALRSGSYRQTTFRLSRKFNKEENETSRYHYCCLGVLCQLAFNEGIVKYIISDNEKIYGDAWCNNTSLPLEVLHWSGMNSEFGLIESEGIELIDLNDNKGKSFKEIADIIEKHYKKL